MKAEAVLAKQKPKLYKAAKYLQLFLCHFLIYGEIKKLLQVKIIAGIICNLSYIQFIILCLKKL